MISKIRKKIIAENWENPEDYSYLEELTPKYMAWEFLRRNAEYQEDWYQISEKYRLENGNYHVDWWIRGYKEENDGGMILNPSDTNLAISITKEFQDKWRIVKLVAPWQPTPSNLAFIEKIGHKLTCDIDLKAPIKPQLDKIAVTAKMHQEFWKIKKTKSKIHWDLLPDYLRVYDAVESGVKTGEIASKIYPDESNDSIHNYPVTHRIDDYYKRACKFVKGDYIKIVMPQNW